MERTTIAVERNRFFTGKYMTARDFSTDQHYFVNRNQLHNRLLHGWGIVYGLTVAHHPEPDCRDRWVIVKPGVALDCLGRELFWQEETAVKLPPPMPTGEDADYKIDPTDEPPIDGPFLLCLRYEEREIEPVPALYAEDECEMTHQEANRIREGCCLQMVRLVDMPPGCWKMREEEADVYWRDDCDTQLPGPAANSLDDNCSCYGLVPLALIQYRSDTAVDGFVIDRHGRTHLPIPTDFLTHITHINWPHGGNVRLSELEARRGQLRIRFDRQLLLPEHAGDQGVGLNEFTFEVQYHGTQRSPEFLSGSVYLEEDNRVAVFKIDPGLLQVGRSIGDHNVFIRLKCDFLLDCHGNPVDGDHLRGRLPSGNGIPGGVFESWFHILPDDRTQIVQEST